MFLECFEIENTLFDVDKISVDDIIAKISNFPIERKYFLYDLLKKVSEKRPFHYNQIKKIVGFICKKYKGRITRTSFKLYNIGRFNSITEDTIEFSIINKDFEKFISLTSDESLIKKNFRFNNFYNF